MTGNQQAYQTAMEQGHSAAWDQNWELAANCYRKALGEFPDNPAALTNLGLALFELQQFSEALKYYQLAAKISPTDPIPPEKMARIFERQGKLSDAAQGYALAAERYLQQKEIDKAIESWSRVIGLQPDHLMARTRLAMVYERMGRKAEAVNEYINTAAIIQNSGDLEKAIKVIDYCLQIVPDHAEAKQARAILRRNQPLPKPSRPRGFTGPLRMAEVLKKEEPKSQAANEMDPIHEARQKALVILANLLFEQGEGENFPQTGARRGISSISRGTGSLSLDNSGDQSRIPLYLGQAVDSQTRGDDRQAAEELERAVEAGLNHPAAFFDLGMIISTSNSEKALKYLSKALGSPDFGLAAHLLTARLQESLNHFSEAALSFIKALSLADITTVEESQADELLQLYEPVLETQRGVTDETALKNLCKNISSHLFRPDWRDHLKATRQQLPVQSPGTSPLPLAEILLETGSPQVVDSLTLIRQLMNEDKIPSAMEEAFQALMYAPTYLPLHVQIGELLLKEDRQQDAIHKFMLVASLYSLRGEANQAIRLLTRISQMSPMDMAIRNRLVDLLTSQGRIQDAIQQTMGLANMYYQLADLEKARQAYSSALRLAQQSTMDRSINVQILNKIADIDLQRLDLRQAILIYEQIRTFEPEDVNARTNLVDLNFRLGLENAAMNEIDSFITTLENAGKRGAAIDFLNGVIAERPEKLELRKRLADLYVRNHRITDAVAQLDTIADALLNAGNQQGAVMMLQTIISLNPPNIAEYKTVLQRIQNL